MAPPGGQGLKAAVRVVTDPDLPLPSGVAIERLWLFYSKEQWRPALPDRAEPLVVQLADGPKWGPGVDADVVVRLKRGKDTWLLRAAGRPIKRTD